jgi:hypothetical protein
MQFVVVEVVEVVVVQGFTMHILVVMLFVVILEGKVFAGQVV